MRLSFWRGAGVGLLTATLGAGIGGHAQSPQPDAQSPQPDAQAPPPAPPQTDGQQTPTFRAGVNFVRVDVIVSNRTGNPVADLKPEDFEVTEQGRPQKVETFKLISLDGGLMQSTATPPQAIISDLDEEREAARDDVRLFAIFLDDYHVRRESSLVMRDQIARFVDTQLGPSDMIGVMYPLELLSSLRMTRNHDAIMKGIEQFEGRKYDYRPRNSFEERYEYYPTEIVEKIRNQVSLSAIKGLITHLGGLKEGRKALILVSEGFTNILPPQLRNPVASQPGLGNPNAGDPLAGSNDPLEDRAATFASWDMEADLRDVSTLANRNNVSIYTVDPRGLAVGEFDLGQNIGQQVDRQYLNSTMETLRTLALQTDGRAIVNRNDILTGMKQIVRDTSAYYLLGYNSTFVATDGKFHEIRVRVKRPGVDVRARKGYWALTRQEVATVTAPPKPGVPKPIENALNSAAAVTSGSHVIRSWIGTDRGENGKTKVTFVWEPTPKLPGAPTRNTDQPARVALTAAGADGSPYYRGRLPTADARVTFDAPPGEMQLRVSVEGAGSDVLDTETRAVVVPDLTSPQTRLSTPRVFHARTVREMQQLKADPNPMPAIGREFSRTDRLLIRVNAYGPGTIAPKVSARLLARNGQAMADLPVSSPEAVDGSSQIEVPLGGIAGGDYILEIDATGAGGDAQELVGIRVTS